MISFAFMIVEVLERWSLTVRLSGSCLTTLTIDLLILAATHYHGTQECLSLFPVLDLFSVPAP